MVDVRFETCVVFGGGKEMATPLLLIPDTGAVLVVVRRCY